MSQYIKICVVSPLPIHSYNHVALNWPLHFWMRWKVEIFWKKVEIIENDTVAISCVKQGVCMQVVFFIFSVQCLCGRISAPSTYLACILNGFDSVLVVLWSKNDRMWPRAAWYIENKPHAIWRWSAIFSALLFDRSAFPRDHRAVLHRQTSQTLRCNNCSKKVDLRDI